MKSLSALLASAPIDILADLAARWGAPAPTDGDLEARQRLERAMRDNVACRFVWEHLDDDERRVLFAVVGPSARNWCLRVLVPERARMAPDHCEAVIARLGARQLLTAEVARVQGGELVGQRPTFYGYAIPRNPRAEVEEKPIIYVPTELATGLYATGRELFMPQADRSEKTLDELLMPYRQGDLDQIGRRFGLSLSAHYSRNEVRTAMAENLSQAEAIRYVLTRIDAPLRTLYEWLLESNGRAPFPAVRLQTGMDDPELAALVRTLEEYALVFDTFSRGERILFIPRETLANLRQAAERPHRAADLVERTVPVAVQPADTPVLWDLAVLVAAAYHQEIELTRSGAFPKRAALRLLPQLAGARDRKHQEDALNYLEQLKQEACELGLVVAPASTSRERARLAPGPKLDSWARHDQVMQARRIFRRWPTNRTWQDMLGADYRDWLAYYIEVPVVREQVRALLHRCRPGVWYSIASFRATIQGEDAFVLRPAQRYAGEAGYRLAKELRAHWDQTDGEVIAGTFRSTLRELGLVAVGYDREAVPTTGEVVNPDAFQLTELGAEVLASEQSAAQPPSPRPLVVQPNFQVLLLEPHMPALYWLVRFAAVDRIGRVSRFTLTRESLLRGLAAGASGDEVMAFLEVHSQKALPQNVAYTLRDWLRHYQESLTPPVVSQVVSRAASRGPARVATPAADGVLLEARDDALARELVTSPKLRAFRLRQVGPRAVAVPPGTSLRELRGALEHLGYAGRLLHGVEELVAAAKELKDLPARGRARARAAAAIKGAV